MKVFRDWEIEYWDEDAREHTIRGTEDVTALENRSPYQFFTQVRRKYPGPGRFVTTLRREDGSIEQEAFSSSVFPVYPPHFESSHELRTLIAFTRENCLETLNFVKEMRNASTRDLIVATLYTFRPMHTCSPTEDRLSPFKELLFIRDWCDEKISGEEAESRFQKFIEHENWKILLQVRNDHEAGIPPSKFLIEAHRHRGEKFCARILEEEFKIKRHLGELMALIDKPKELDRIFLNLE